MPERFDLTCINEQGEKERVVMIHAAIMGSIERFMSILIEHTGGNFPLWLAPEQVRVITVADVHVPYAEEVYHALKAVGIRASFDDAKDSMGKKIRAAKQARLPYFIVVGDKEMTDKMVTLESRDDSSQELPLHTIGNHLLTEIDTKKM
jgi:threonyl-tRNA synthetase